MDASDALRKLQAKTIFTYYRLNVYNSQPACNTTTCSSITGCITTFPTYDERQKVSFGRQQCNNCSGQGCSCNGGT